jgi:hypothetical protein
MAGVTRALGHQVLQEERHTAERPIGERAGRFGTRLLEERRDDGVTIAASTSSAGVTSPLRTSSAWPVASSEAGSLMVTSRVRLGHHFRLGPVC